MINVTPLSSEEIFSNTSSEISSVPSAASTIGSSTGSLSSRFIRIQVCISSSDERILNPQNYGAAKIRLFLNKIIENCHINMVIGNQGSASVIRTP